MSDDGSRLLSLVHSRTGPAAILVSRVGLSDQPGRVNPTEVPFLLKPAPSRNSTDRSTPPLHLSADGSRVLAARPDGTIQVWDLTHPPGYSASWPEELTVNGVACQRISDVEGPWIVYGNRRPLAREEFPKQGLTIALYDPVRGRVVQTIAFDTSVTVRQVSLDGRRLLAAGRPAPGAPRGTGPINRPDGRVTSNIWSLWSLDDPAKAVELCRFDLAVRHGSRCRRQQFRPCS